VELAALREERAQRRERLVEGPARPPNPERAGDQNSENCWLQGSQRQNRDPNPDQLKNSKSENREIGFVELLATTGILLKR